MPERGADMIGWIAEEVAQRNHVALTIMSKGQSPWVYG